MSQPKQFPLAKSIRFTVAQWAKLKSLGGPAWLRALLDGQPLPAPPKPDKVRRRVIDAAYLRGRGGISTELQRAWFDGAKLRHDACYFDQSGERDRVFLADRDDADKPRAT